jgi:hypothetical protein
MTCTPKVFAALAVLVGAAVAISGCSDKKRKGAPPNTTGGDGTVEVIEETTLIKEAPTDAKPAAAPADTPPAPEEKKADDSPQQSSGNVLLGSPELTTGIPGEGQVKIGEIEAWLADPKNHEPLDFELPMGLATGAT